MPARPAGQRDDRASAARNEIGDHRRVLHNHLIQLRERGPRSQIDSRLHRRIEHRQMRDERCVNGLRIVRNERLHDRNADTAADVAHQAVERGAVAAPRAGQGRERHRGERHEHHAETEALPDPWSHDVRLGDCEAGTQHRAHADGADQAPRAISVAHTATSGSHSFFRYQKGRNFITGVSKNAKLTASTNASVRISSEFEPIGLLATIEHRLQCADGKSERREAEEVKRVPRPAFRFRQIRERVEQRYCASAR